MMCMCVCVCVVVLIVQSWFFSDLIDYSPPGFSVHGVSQARIPEWVAFFLSRGSPQPKNRTQVSCIVGRFFTIWATGKMNSATINIKVSLLNLFCSLDFELLTLQKATDSLVICTLLYFLDWEPGILLGYYFSYLTWCDDRLASE